MKKTVVTYQFSAFPATYWAHRKEYRLDCLSKFSFDTLAEARQEVQRLRKIYKKIGRNTEERHEGLDNFLQIFRVEKTPIEDKR